MKAGKFLEHAEVHGNLYGTTYQAVEIVGQSGRCCVLDIDVQGARLVYLWTCKTFSFCQTVLDLRHDCNQLYHNQ